MLVLSRRIGERMMIGDDIEVTVVEVQGNRVKLSIEAPRQIPIVRKKIMHLPPKAKRVEPGTAPVLPLASITLPGAPAVGTG